MLRIKSDKENVDGRAESKIDGEVESSRLLSSQIFKSSLRDSVQPNIRFESTVSMHNEFDFKNRLYCSIAVPTSPLIEAITLKKQEYFSMLDEDNLSIKKSNVSSTAQIKSYFYSTFLWDVKSNDVKVIPTHLVDVPIPESILESCYMKEYLLMAARLERELASYRHHALLDGTLQGASITEFDLQWGIKSVYVPKNIGARRMGARAGVSNNNSPRTNSPRNDVSDQTETPSSFSRDKRHSISSVASTYFSNNKKNNKFMINIPDHIKSKMNTQQSKLKNVGNGIIAALKIKKIDDQNKEKLFNLHDDAPTVDIVPSIKWKDPTVLAYLVAETIQLEHTNMKLMRDLPQHAIAAELMGVFFDERLGKTNTKAKTFKQKSNRDFKRVMSVPNFIKGIVIGLMVLLNAFFIFFCISNGVDKGVAWQRAWLGASILKIILDVLVSRFLQLIIIQFYIPELITDEINSIKQDLFEAAEALATTNYRYKLADFSASDYLHSSTRIAFSMPSLIESKLILATRQPLPMELAVSTPSSRKKTGHDKHNSLIQTISFFLITFALHFGSLPNSVQKACIHVIPTALLSIFTFIMVTFFNTKAAVICFISLFLGSILFITIRVLRPPQKGMNDAHVQDEPNTINTSIRAGESHA
jgi:hypothetical protein